MSNPPAAIPLAKQIEIARLSVVEKALVGFIEEVDGRIPGNDEILREGVHLQFARSPLGTYEKDGQKWHRFYAWRKQHLLALGFIDGEQPLTLFVVRVPKEQWPAAVCAYLAQHGVDPAEPHDPADDWKKSEE